MQWSYECDAPGCKASVSVPALSASPPGWLTRTIIDRVETLDEGATGTGFPGGRSELQKVRHFCPACRRKQAA
jgi:hypothetical protein